MTPTEMLTKVEVVDDDDVRAAVSAALAQAGVTLEELRRQAAAGEFSSERARIAWFMIENVAD